ncbi:response regulator transcription factor [Microbacterium sp. ARD32]|uniref:response regulator transcription factor n=1 Tax=Microbacterium sp. ARD32 TaxID=2962577 RepID=UPI0028827164|nr:response regulator transcription factor [Microbacterium sp. ARD32]MDT0156388.1 response regulator transcription factor [Microbacterium sp. ARD32]
MFDASPLRTAVVIEDDPDVRHLLAQTLESAGFAVITVDNGIDGVDAVIAHHPVVTTLDVNMPGIDGFETARRIRAASDTYIVMLTALDEEADIVLGLGAGADEYLSKPFRPRELRARIDALLRRPRVLVPATVSAAMPVVDERMSATVSTGGVAVQQRSAATQTTDAAWAAHRDLRLNSETRIVLMSGTEVELTRTEFDLLEALMESRRRVRSKADLALLVHGDSYAVSDRVTDADKRAIEAHMTNLRRKLGDRAMRPNYIETVRGVGYRLTADDAG